MKPYPSLLLGPRIRQCPGKASDREVRRRGPIDDRRNYARRQEGKRSQQADVPFSLDLTLGDLGEGANATKPEIVDPSPGLGDCGQQSIASLGFHCRICARHMHNALHRLKAWRGPGTLDPKRFTIRTVPALLSRSKAWANYCDWERPLEQAIKRLGRSRLLVTLARSELRIPLAMVS